MRFRMSKEQYFMKIAMTVAQRSTCLRRNVGAVFVKDDNIVATGYNGVPIGFKHCENCVREESGKDLHLCHAVHAEQNAIVQAAKHGISLKGSFLYCTTLPCIECARLLINLEISEVHFLQDYHGNETTKMFRNSGILVYKQEGV